MLEGTLPARPRLRLVRHGELPPAVARARGERSARRMVSMLAMSAAALTVVGLVMVLSASSVSAYARYGSSFLYFKRQLLYAGVGSLCCLGAARLDYRVWKRLWGPLLSVTVILLLLVLHPAAGTVAGGSARWIMLGPVSIQPSEVAKVAVIFAASAILANNFKYLDDPIRWALPLIPIVGAVCALILLQPDLGTAMVVVASVFLLLLAAGVRMRLLVVSGVLGLASGMGLILTARYRRARFLSFLHPWSDPQNAGYQIVQSLIALGSGQVTGVGLGASRQKWMYVPNAHTDFIFAILGEELGLMGEVVVLGLFVTLIYAGVRIAVKAPDAFGRLLAAGVVAWFGFQALVNLGAVTGLLPITGVPLPFVSFGGSSLVVSLSATGVLLSIGRAGLAATLRGTAPAGGPQGVAGRRRGPAGREA